MRQKGFTLIELLIVLTLFALMFGFGLSFTINSLRQSYFHTNMQSLKSLLVQARAAAMNNKSGLAHGVRIEPYKVTYFLGDTYQLGLGLNPKASTVLVPSPNTIDVIFQPLSGSLSNPISFTLTDGVHNQTITINEQGIIN